MGYRTSNGRLSSLKFFPWIVCGLGAIFYTYEYLLRIAPSVMTADLMQTFSINAEMLGNLIAFYYYAYAPAQLVVGVFMDRYGPRRMLFFACLLCAVGTYLFGATDSLTMAAFGRFLVGLGSAFAFVGVLKLATIWLPPNRFAMIAGLTAALGTVGAMFGEVVLTELVVFYDWRSTMLVSAGLGIVLAVILILFLRDGTKDARVHDRTVTTGFVDIISQLKGMVTNRALWINGLIGCLLYLPATAFAELWAYPYFQSGLGYSANEAAFAVLAVFFGFTVGGPCNGWLSDKLGSRRLPMIAGSVVAAAIMAIVLYVPEIPKTVVFFLMFLLGLFYSAQVIVFAVARDISPTRTAGTALALTNFLVMIGGVVFQPCIGKLLDMSWDGSMQDGINVYSLADYTFALSVLPAFILVSAFLAYILRETYSGVQQEELPATKESVCPAE